MRRSQKGFTVVESMLFLAISAFMFTIAFVGTRSQQDSVAFRQSINSIELKIREAFNNADNGYFGNAGQYTCTFTTIPTPTILITPDTTGGGNSECVFLGKIIGFSADGKTMNIDTLISNRENDTQAIATPTALREAYKLDYNVVFNKVKVGAVSGTNYLFGATRGRNNDPDIAGDLRANRYYYAGTTWPLNESSLTAVNDTDHKPVLCFTFSNKTASITITQKDLVVSYNGEGCS